MAGDGTSQTYYPRCAVHLLVRFDEFGAVSPLRAAAPTKTTKNLSGTQTNRSGLSAQLDPTAPPGVTRYVIGPPGGNSTPTPPQSQTQSSDGLTWDLMVIPKHVTWNQNGLRKAATCKITLHYVDFPIDPRLCRSIAVELILGCIDEDTAALEADGDWQGQGAPIIPRDWVDAYGKSRTNVRFQGFVDDYESDIGDDGEPTLELECSDNTQLLIDQEHSPRLVLDMTKPLDQAIAGYLANYVQFSGLTVEYRPAGDSPPVLKQVLSGTAYRPNLGPQASRGGSGSGPTKTSCLDYLTEVVGSVGHSLRMDGTTLIIQRVRSILTNSTTARPDDPYTPRTINGRTFDSRAFIYGRNLKSMRFKRDFRRHAHLNVEVRAYLPEKKKLLVARFPKVSATPSTQDSQIKALPGATQPDQKWTVVHVAGINDQPTLNRFAQDYYEALGRQEFEASIATKNLGSFGGDNTDPDVFDMKFGDTFQLLVNRTDDETNTVTQIEEALTIEGKAKAFLSRLGFPDGFAQAVATAYSNSGFSYAFRMHTMSCTWDEEGVKFDITAVNYVEVRADKLLPPGQEPGNTAIPSQSLPAGDSFPA